MKNIVKMLQSDSSMRIEMRQCIDEVRCSHCKVKLIDLKKGGGGLSAIPESYELPFKALEYIMDAEVSCNACVMVSFSDDLGVKRVTKKLEKIRPGLLKSLELEHITMFPKVAQRLAAEDMRPRSIQVKGRVIGL